MAAVVNIVANYFMIPVWGIKGASIATMISYIMLFVFHHIIAHFAVKEAKYHYKFRTFVPGIIAVAVTGAVFYLLLDYAYVRWGLGVVLGIYILVRMIRQKSIF